MTRSTSATSEASISANGVGERVQVPSRGATEQRDELSLAKAGDLADGADAQLVQPPRRLRSDAPEPLDRQRVQERELAVGRHEQQAVRLGDPARHLGQELRARDSDGDREPDPLAHRAPELRRHLGRRAREPSHAAHVEERLVDRESLHARRDVLEDLVDGLAGLGVGGHARLDYDRARTEAARTGDAHRRAHPAGLRLVAGREHDPGPDDHRPPAQPWVVPLLDGREEGVQVGVQDRRLHEHMFA